MKFVCIYKVKSTQSQVSPRTQFSKELVKGTQQSISTLAVFPYENLKIKKTVHRLIIPPKLCQYTLEPYYSGESKIIAEV